MNFRTKKFGVVAAKYGIVVSVGGTTTLDPSHIGTSIILSGGNLTATEPQGSGLWETARSIASHASGKFYLEATDVSESASDGAGNGSVALGFGNAAVALENYAGSDSNGLSYSTGGGVFINGASVTTIQSSSAGDIISMALDIGAELAWFRTNGGNWNNSGTANPATGVGGISISSVSAGPYFAAPSGYGGPGSTNDAVITMNFGGTPYSFTPPIGFGNW